MFLVYVFDGLRPELVCEDLMPNLFALRVSGTWFERSHCVFPSVTRVNAASLATGSYPSVHGIPSNTLYLPESGRDSAFATTGDVAVLRSLRNPDGGRLLGAPTTAEVLAQADLRTLAVGTGSPGCAYLLNPEATASGNSTFHYSFSEPAELLGHVESRIGRHRGMVDADGVAGFAGRVQHATHAVVDVLLAELEPDLLYFWSTVPDALHHRFGLGSLEAAEGLRMVDQSFGELLSGLRRRYGTGVDVIVTADHGYATVDRRIDIAAELAGAGFKTDERTGVAVTVDGGAAHLVCRREAAHSLERLVEYLAGREWLSALFTRKPAAGALPLNSVMVDGQRAADIIACFAWRHGENAGGVNGFSAGGGAIPSGAGDHGGSSPFEMRNTLIASGPAFKSGVSTLASGIVDVAPTVCRVLGVPTPHQWSGRVLREALIDDAAPARRDDREIRSTPATTGATTCVTITQTDGTRYLSAGYRAT